MRVSACGVKSKLGSRISRSACQITTSSVSNLGCADRCRLLHYRQRCRDPLSAALWPILLPLSSRPPSRKTIRWPWRARSWTNSAKLKRVRNDNTESTWRLKSAPRAVSGSRPWADVVTARSHRLRAGLDLLSNYPATLVPDPPNWHAEQVLAARALCLTFFHKQSFHSTQALLF